MSFKHNGPHSSKYGPTDRDFVYCFPELPSSLNIWHMAMSSVTASSLRPSHTIVRLIFTTVSGVHCRADGFHYASTEKNGISVRFLEFFKKLSDQVKTKTAEVDASLHVTERAGATYQQADEKVHLSDRAKSVWRVGKGCKSHQCHIMMRRQHSGK